MGLFSPTQSSDIRTVISSIITNKVKIQQLNEDNKEAIKGIVDKFEGLIEKSEVNTWVKWAMEPQKQIEDQEKIEESALKFQEIMKSKKAELHDSRPLDLDDLDD